MPISRRRCDLVRDIGYRQAFSFKYTTRPGTPASAMRKQIPEDVKAERLDVLQKLLLKQQYAFNDSQIGKTRAGAVRKARRATRARPWAARPICSRCMSMPMPALIGEIDRGENRQAHCQQPAWRSAELAKQGVPA